MFKLELDESELNEIYTAVYLSVDKNLIEVNPHLESALYKLNRCLSNKTEEDFERLLDALVELEDET